MRNWLYRFMMGRYGSDNLNRVLSVAALVCMVISIFALQGIFYPLSLILLIACFYRMLSKNTHQRSRENYAFLSLLGKIGNWFTGTKNRILQSNTHYFFKCPSCRTGLRVPKGKGRIKVTCPKCKMTVEKTT